MAEESGAGVLETEHAVEAERAVDKERSWQEESVTEGEMQECTDVATDSAAPAVDDKNVVGAVITEENFGKAMDLLQLSQSELFALGRSFELMLTALGGDRDRVGDAIYGAKTTRLITAKERTRSLALTETTTRSPTKNDRDHQEPPVMSR
eukprot:Skav211945  [mRNA]  locus=scaffold1086:762172:764871:- [translate_table: standard]